MSYGSSVPEVIDALFTRLRARPGLAHVAVSDEYPKNPGDIAGDTGVLDAVFVGREGEAAVSGTTVYPFLGHQSVDETYTLWVTCQSLKDDSDGTQVLARQRAYELMAEVVGTILADPTLGITPTAEMSTFDIGRGDTGPYEIQDGGGWLASGGHGWRVLVGVNCAARITLS